MNDEQGMEKVKKKPTLRGQSLPEVLTSMLLLGILMMVAYSALQRGMGMASPAQQYVHAEMLREMMSEDWQSGETEYERKGRLLKRKVICLDEKEGIYEVDVRCFVGEKQVAGYKRIIRKTPDKR